MAQTVEEVGNEYILCKSETMFKVLKGLEFKGGSSKRFGCLCDCSDNSW